MDAKEIDDMCKKLIMTWKWPVDLKTSLEQWNALGLSLNQEDQVKLFSCLIDNDNVFRWLFLISEKLPALASANEEFLSLVEKIAIKVKGDLAQGPFLRVFIQIGSSNPTLGLSLYKSMIQTKNEPLIFHAGLVLGGVGKENFNEAFGIIKKGIEEGSPAVKSACIRALRVIFENAAAFKEEDEIFKILRLSSDPQEDFIIRAEAANSYVDFDKFRPCECEDQLLDLAKQEDSNLRFVIANRLWLGHLTNGEAEIDILAVCGTDENKETLGRVAYALAAKGKLYPEKSLEIIRSWVKREKYFEIRELDYCLQEIGKGNLAKCIEIVESWVELEKDPGFQFHIPDILTELSSDNFQQLLESVRKWSDGEEKSLRKVAVRTINRMVTRVGGKPSEETMGQSFSVMKKLAMDDELQEIISSNFVEIFGGRPRFTDVKKIISILESWANDKDWKIRRASITALRVLAEDKIDSELTLKMLVNEKTKETKIVGTKTRKVELLEGAESYRLLQKLTTDENEIVKREAIENLQWVDKRLQEKETSIKEEEYSIKEQPDQPD